MRVETRAIGGEPRPDGRREAERIVVLAGGGVAGFSGGVGTLTLYLMDEWARRGDFPRVRVIDTRGAGGLVGGAGRFALATVALAWLAATGRASLVHAHMTTRGSVLRKCILCSLAMLLGRPVIVHMHGADFMDFFATLGPAPRRLIAAVLRRARHVVALGEGWRRFLIDTVGVPEDRIALVMNGVPAPAARPTARPEGGPVRLLFLGRLGERKGVPELLRALASEPMRSRGWTAVIAGDGDLRRFRDEAASAQLLDRVTMPGWLGREDAARELAQADILVLPSHHEVMPIAVIEALAHGVAVVATPVGVIPEVLQDGVSARLVPPGDDAALAEALAALIDDPAARARLGEAGREVFRARLDISVVADRIAGLYRSAIDGEPRVLQRQLQPSR